MRYLIRLRNEGLPSTREAVLHVHRELSQLGLPRYGNVRISPAAVEFDLYEEDDSELDVHLESVKKALGKVLTVKDLSAQGVPMAVEDSLHAALELYSEHRFWEAHEALEPRWRALKKDDPLSSALQGIILLCAAYVHRQKGEDGVALSILRRASAKLAEYGERSLYGVDMKALRKKIDSMVSAGKVRYVRLRSKT